MTRGLSIISMAVLVGLMPPVAAGAQPGRSAVSAGNKLYDEGRFDEAHEQYLEALRAAPDSSIAPFNDGNALYRTGEFQRAMEAYQQATDRDDPVVLNRPAGSRRAATRPTGNGCSGLAYLESGRSRRQARARWSAPACPPSR